MKKSEKEKEGEKGKKRRRKESGEKEERKKTKRNLPYALNTMIYIQFCGRRHRQSYYGPIVI